MKHAIRLTILCCLLNLLTFAQQTENPVRFTRGNFITGDNVLRGTFRKTDLSTALHSGNYYVLIQFRSLPGKTTRLKLEQAGIRLEQYLPENAYLCVIPEGFDFSGLRELAVGSVNVVPSVYRMDADVTTYQPQPGKENTMVMVLQCSRFADAATIQKAITEAGGNLLTRKWESGHVWRVQFHRDLLPALSQLPFVYNISLVAQNDRALNYNTRSASGAGALNSALGKNLNGSGVVLGIGDNADISSHLDFTGRLINRSPWVPSNHGTHVAGTAAGAGIINPKNRGMAAKATVVNQFFSDIIVNAPVYYNDFNMVVTNNSYHSAANGCAGEGDYNVLSVYADDQLNNYPNLLHVVAAGNDGALTCSPYPASFGTVKSGWQSAKNVLTVGALNTDNYNIASYSSRGPVADGRIKPEITANGFAVTSTNANNNYGVNYGTSMAAPAVTGALTLMHERFRQRNAGANPKSALMKAIVCNTADDLGNPGPDYTYGFGMVNALRAVEAIDSSRYAVSSISGNSSNTHPFTVPPNTRRLKVLLYWHDAPAAANAATTLINDLDLSVLTPSIAVRRPLIPSATPANVNLPATEAADHLNNIEQVIIENPSAGNYTASINGFSLPDGAQEYAVSWEIIPNGITVMHPAGGETLVPGESETIRWSAAGNESNAFTVEYSVNNGSSWTLLAASVPGSSRSLTWTVPADATSGALIRVTRNNTSFSDQSDRPFTILGQPVINASNACPGSVQLSWAAVAGAAAYDVLQLTADSMRIVGTTTGNSFLLNGLNKNQTVWLSVAARMNSAQGRRSLAVSILPNSGGCSSSAFNNDLRVDSILEPNSARRFFSNAGNASRPVRVTIRNAGNTPVSGPISVTLGLGPGNSPLVTENMSSIPAGGTITYTFTGGLSLLPNGGDYPLKVWVSHPADPIRNNDTAYKIVKDIPNNPITALPYSEDFESLPPLTAVNGEMAVGNNPHLDFKSNTERGRMRSFVNTGMAVSGNRALTLDQAPYNTSTNADSAIFSYNLSGYTGKQLRIDFYYKNHGQADASGNRVWIRGSENNSWMEAYDLFSNQGAFGEWTKAIINVNDVLGTQNVSATFQLKLGQEGNTSANSVEPEVDLDDGYTFDNLLLNEAINDITLTSILSPDKSGCGLTGATPLTIRLRNYQNTALNNIQVNYQVNGGPVITETIASIGALQSIDYSFNQLLNLSAYMDYDISVWAKYNGDTYASNDSILHFQLHNSPVISSFPYHESFENSNGFYYTKGTNNSWVWGTPGKAIINKAPNGNKAWVTGTTGNYNDNETSYLYSPCFNLAPNKKWVLSFSHIYDVEQDYDYTWVEYTTDGKTWNKLGLAGEGTNWYDVASLQTWGGSNTRWHAASIDLPPALFQNTSATLRFRWVMSSDGGVTQEGVAIDDVRIHERMDIAGSPIPLLPQTVSGPWNNSWISFNYGDAVAGPWWVVGEINTRGQQLGDVTIIPYLNYNNPVRSSANEYYLDKSFVVKSTLPLAGPVSLRLYFSEQQVSDMLNSADCPSCVNPADAYVLGVLNYKGSTTEEDSSLENNADGIYRFILPDSTLILPHNEGYYAEFNTNTLGEFWFARNNMAPDLRTQCAGNIIRFQAAPGATSYQWQVNNGNGYQQISDGVNYNGSNSSTLEISGLPSSNTGYRYRCVVDGSPGIEYTLRFRNIWTGDAGTNWFTPANWSCGSVPDQFTDVVIPGGLTHYPVLTNNTAVRSLRVLAGVPVQINDGVELEIKGRVE